MELLKIATANNSGTGAVACNRVLTNAQKRTIAMASVRRYGTPRNIATLLHISEDAVRAELGPAAGDERFAAAQQTLRQLREIGGSR